MPVRRLARGQKLLAFGPASNRPLLIRWGECALQHGYLRGIRSVRREADFVAVELWPEDGSRRRRSPFYVDSSCVAAIVADGLLAETVDAAACAEPALAVAS